MVLDSDLVHPSLAGVRKSLVRHADLTGVDLPEAPRLVAETIVALLGSARMPDEMRGYASRLNAALDAEPKLDESHRAALLEALRDARRGAQGLESARSGMAGDICLDILWMALDDAEKATKPAGG